jgi:predicted dehydrogenase
MGEGRIWLVGAGPMAVAHAAVLDRMGRDYEVVGRSQASADAFTAKTGRAVRTGGLEQALAEGAAPTHAIVATGCEVLAATTLALLRAGTANLLVEKPAGLSGADVAAIGALAAQRNARVVIAYNRRCFASVEKARELIAEDGGLQSMTFDFTEMADKVGRMDRLQAVKERWLLANSTHVIDLAFHFGGKPADWCAHRAGRLDWHPAGAVFAGSGITGRNVLFSYTANWQGPGRWGLELVTARRRLVLRPMEVLQASSAALSPPEPVACDTRFEDALKPGLYRQMEAFLGGEDGTLCTLAEHMDLMPAYERIAGYAP